MLMFFHYVALALLAGRAAFTADPPWRRIAAVAVVGIALLLPKLYMVTGRLDLMLHSMADQLCIFLVSLYLLSWAFISRDHVAVRLASALVALIVLVPLVLALAIAASVTF